VFLNYQPTPSPVSAVPALDALSPGGYHGLGLDTSGTVWSWGQNFDGELGNGTITCCVTTPAPVPGLSGVVSVAAGLDFSLAARGDGSVWAWGADDVGQLGDGGLVSRATPQQVPGLSGIVAVAADPSWRSSYALRSDGTVWAWGSNLDGQLGDGSLTDRRTPVQVKGLTDVVALAARSAHVLALRADGSVWSWGTNGFGELGRGLAADRALLAGPVPGLSDIVAVAGGPGFSLALDSSGHVWAWGFNLFGELGDGTTTSQSAPEQLAAPANVIAIGASYGTSYAATAAGALYSWGTDEFGELGNGSVSSTPQLTPELVTSLTGVFAVWGANNDAYALSSP
jgi:alpha-tubulin suppressor-like RCC1 family protein